MKPLSFALALLAAGGSAAFACAPAPHAGDVVAILEESAVIVWDPATKTEHFIRRATFRGKGHDFGFLVPTPTAPLLAEVDDGIFDKLEARTERETVYVTRRKIDWTPLLLLGYAKREEGAVGLAEHPVEVLSTQKIAGYEAVVLAATDAAALRQWLSDHGYAATEDLTEWLDAYVRQQWKITAFKVDATQPAARTSAVKMSFTTERPFFPYREPASQRRIASDPSMTRALRIWFVGPERVSGTIGASTPWPAELRRSDMLPDPWRADLARIAKLTLPAAVRLTAFLDQATIRPGADDLFFTRAADQSTFVLPPYIVTTIDKTHVPLDLVFVALVVIGVVVWLYRR
jgi:hypothetical protein